MALLELIECRATPGALINLLLLKASIISGRHLAPITGDVSDNRPRIVSVGRRRCGTYVDRHQIWHVSQVKELGEHGEPRKSGKRQLGSRTNTFSTPHFHSEVQHRPLPQRARSPGAEDRPVMANPGPGAPEIRARGDRSPVETQRSRALRTVQAAPRGRRRPAGRREGGARPRSAGRRRPFLSPDQSLRNAVRDGSGQGGRAFRNASAGVM